MKYPLRFAQAPNSETQSTGNNESSWERGFNEYTNKLIRKYIIKGISFELYTKGHIQLTHNKINRRPRE